MVILYVGNKEQDIKVLSQVANNSSQLKVIFTDNRGTAIDVFTKERIDLVLLDVSEIEEKNNFKALNDFAKTIRKFREKIIIYAIATKKDQAFNAIKIGVEDIFLTPLSVETVNKFVTEFSIRFPEKKIFIQTMPDFQIYLNGKPIPLKRKTEKEILAYLVHRQGEYVTINNLIQALYPEILESDELAIKKARNRIRVAICSLKKFLEQYDLIEIFELPNENRDNKERNFTRFNSSERERATSMRRVKPEKFTCDIYELFDGNLKYIQKYNHKYLESYSWAESRKADINNYLMKIGKYFPCEDEEE